MAGSSLRYVIVSIVRDEEPNIADTVASVTGQSQLPAHWFIVDDGSTDATPRIIAEAAAETPWIEVVTLPRRKERAAWHATSEGFNRMLPRVRALNPFAVVKLDGDVRFAPDYFEQLLTVMEDNHKLGIVGGVALEPHRDGSWGRVYIPHYHVHGATKVYRWELMEQMGGLVPGAGWDTADIIKARVAGWDTRSIPEVQFYHLRVTGTGAGRRKNLFVKGRSAYRMGYIPLFAMIRGIRNMVRRPYILGGFAFIRGYLIARKKSEPLALSSEELAVFRREQIRALTGRRSWWS